MLKHATSLSSTSSGLPSLFYHNLFTLSAKSLSLVDNKLALLRDPVYGSTVLMVAAAKNRIPQLHWAVKCGADIGATDAVGMTALHYAAHSGSEDAVRFLLNAGANINQPDTNGKTPKDVMQKSRLRKLLVSY